MKQSGAQQLADINLFVANPFVFKGRTVALPLAFVRMTTEDEALMKWGNNIVLLEGVPSTMFVAPNQEFVIAVQSMGTKETSILGATASIAYGSYKGAYTCSQRNCSEFYD